EQELSSMIHSYISYYNSRRVQRNLGILTPLEKYNAFLAA
ncbi:MAG: IS3 family transposase, partial [Selenomonas sp.]|nr:IS3 family transposase [Selenomonas sp.]